MKRSPFLFFALFLGLCWGAGPGSGQNKVLKTDDPAILPLILEKCAAYCGTLEASSLNFVCREKVVEEAFNIGPSRDEMPTPSSFRTEGQENLQKAGPTNTSWFTVSSLDAKRISKKERLYDLRFIKNGSEISESMTLEGENGPTGPQENASPKTPGYPFEKILFGPAALLGRDAQPKHDYRVIGKEVVNETLTTVISAVPKPGIDEDYFSAKIWVARVDGSVVKIEWSLKSLQELRRAQKLALNLDLRPAFARTAVYGYRKDGMRYPTAFSILEAFRFGETEAIFPSCKLSVAYSAFRPM